MTVGSKCERVPGIEEDESRLKPGKDLQAVLVFDLGGVLYDFQGARLIAQASRRRLEQEEVRERWLPLVRRFETGHSSEAEFAADVVHTFDLELEPAAFVVAFRAAAVGFYGGALDLIGLLRERHTVLSLSNTNAVQWPVVLAGLAVADSVPRAPSVALIWVPQA